MSIAKSIFGDNDPIDSVVTLDGLRNLKVAGIYEDLPYNCDFHNLHFLAPWDFYTVTNSWVKDAQQQWGENAWQLFVQLDKHADNAKINVKIANLLKVHGGTNTSTLFIEPMSNWHLHAEFKNGQHSGGKIEFVWLFAAIGSFVLLLACVNFMNLSTARSERRILETGIRKAIGSTRAQLITQFLSESVFLASIGFLFSLALTLIFLPWFNELSGKHINFPSSNIFFWLSAGGLILFTGLISGGYPAFFFSSFDPVKALKGSQKTSRYASCF